MPQPQRFFQQYLGHLSLIHDAPATGANEAQRWGSPAVLGYRLRNALAPVQLTLHIHCAGLYALGTCFVCPCATYFACWPLCPRALRRAVKVTLVLAVLLAASKDPEGESSPAIGNKRCKDLSNY
eukprot:1160843-Pelagomonas_calceolata.AAC.2